MSTTQPGRAADPSAAIALGAAPARRRLVGLVLLLGGLGLLDSSLFVPWLIRACIARCGTPGFTWWEGLGPFAYGTSGNPVVSPWSWPYWVVVAVVGLVLVRQERVPLARRRAAPTLVLAGIVLSGAVLAFLSLLFSLFGFGVGALAPVMTSSLGPGCGVTSMGTLLVAFGGWLRYHPSRTVPPATGGVPPRPDLPSVPLPPGP